MDIDLVNAKLRAEVELTKAKARLKNALARETELRNVLLEAELPYTTTNG